MQPDFSNPDRSGSSPSALVFRSILPAPPQAIEQLAWSYDGSLLAAGYSDGPVRLWDLWGEVVREFNGHGKFAWSSIGDFAWIDEDGLHIERLGSDRGPLRSIRRADRATAVDWSPDGSRLIFGTTDGFVVMKQPNDRPEKILRGLPSIKFVVWSRLDTLLILGNDGYLGSCHLDSRKREVTPCAIPDATAVAVAKDGKICAVGRNDGRITILTLPSGSEARGDFFGHAGGVQDLSFSADGLLLASKGEDQRVILWRLKPPGPVAVIEEPPVQDDEGLFFWSSAIAFNPALPLLATSERTVRLWNFDAELLALLPGNEKELSLKITPPSETQLEDIEPSGRGIGSKRLTSSSTPSRIEFYSPSRSSRLADAPLTMKSAESYVVAFRGGIQVKDRQHESAVAILAKHLQTHNATVGTPHPLDLFMSAPASVIFETKKVGNCHPGYAVREAVGQLLEYRYFIGPRDACLCIVIDAPPRDSALTEYVEKELGMLFLWITDGTVSGGPLTAEFFCNAGIKIGTMNSDR